MPDTKRKPHLWCLYGAKDSLLIEGLLFDEARAIVSSVQVEELANWLVWREDWPDWRAVNEIEGLTEMIFRNLVAAPPPIPNTSSVAASVAKDSFSEEINLTDSFIQISSAEDLTQSGQFVVRKNRRFKKRYEISIIVDEQVFDTHSLDISVGGILLEDSLPSWVQGQFKVRIRKPNIKQQIELTACVIKDPSPGKESRVEILPLQSVDDEKNLETWLAA